MYEGINLVFIRSFIFFNIKYEYNITLRNLTSEHEKVVNSTCVGLHDNLLLQNALYIS